MTRKDIDEYFAQIPVWMKADISREIKLARASSTDVGIKALAEIGVTPGGGNLLAALGLVSYTEALGLLRLWNGVPRTYGTPEQCFLAFFDQMAGDEYRDWRTEWETASGVTLYEALRCGLVHEYQPKVDSAFWIGDGESFGLDVINGRLTFKVEPYYRHFTTEVGRLYSELQTLPDPQIPPPLRKTQGGRAKPAPPPSSPPAPRTTLPTS